MEDRKKLYKEVFERKKKLIPSGIQNTFLPLMDAEEKEVKDVGKLKK